MSETRLQKEIRQAQFASNQKTVALIEAQLASDRKTAALVRLLSDASKPKISSWPLFTHLTRSSV